MFNFINALEPKFSQHNIKKWWRFQSSISKYKFDIKNAKMGNYNTKMGNKNALIGKVFIAKTMLLVFSCQ